MFHKERLDCPCIDKKRKLSREKIVKIVLDDKKRKLNRERNCEIVKSFI